MTSSMRDRTHTANVLDEVSDEREKQRARWGNAHDDGHTDASLAMAGSSYAMAAAVSVQYGLDHQSLAAPDEGSGQWPWGQEEWRLEATPRATLVKAAALIVAEIERLDRVS